MSNKKTHNSLLIIIFLFVFSAILIFAYIHYHCIVDAIHCKLNNIYKELLDNKSNGILIMNQVDVLILKIENEKFFYNKLGEMFTGLCTLSIAISGILIPISNQKFMNKVKNDKRRLKKFDSIDELEISPGEKVEEYVQTTEQVNKNYKKLERMGNELGIWMHMLIIYIVIYISYCIFNIFFIQKYLNELLVLIQTNLK